MKHRGSVEAVESVVAPTGTYSLSLTISGEPVATGTSGGASTLQDAYDNGSGEIAVALGKPFKITGVPAPEPAFHLVGSGLVEQGDFNVSGTLRATEGIIADAPEFFSNQPDLNSSPRKTGLFIKQPGTGNQRGHA